MKLHRNCITDPTAKAWWRDYQKMCAEGNPLGLSFTEYIAQRTLANQPTSYTAAAESPWYVAACGHQHLWGQSCSEMAVTT